MSPLRESVRRVFLPYSIRFESSIPWFYMDVRSYVTIAVGVLCDPVPLALCLPMRWPDGRRATKTEIAADWSNVKREGSLAHRGAAAAGKVAVLRLDPEDVEAVSLAKLDAMVRALAQRFPAFASFPAPAQLALCSWAWAVGAGSKDFPKMFAAIDAGDWATAAAECRIDPTGNPGVVPRSAAQKALFLAAAAGGDPDALVLPWEAKAPPPGLDTDDVLALMTIPVLRQSVDDALVADRDAYYRRQESGA